MTAFALISLMFLLMVRVTDPLMPRAMFGVLNTLLYFPSGAVYPQQGFPGWMQVIAVADPFTYAVHAFKSLLLKNTGFAAITADLGVPARVLRRRDDRGDACCSGGRYDRGASRSETRERLLKAAARLFAERGFKRVTVRDICRDGAGERGGGELSLRRQARAVPRGACRSAIDAMRGTTEAARGRPATGSRRGEAAAVRPHVPAAAAGARARRPLHRLIHREMHDPTPALDAIVDQRRSARASNTCRGSWRG